MTDSLKNVRTRAKTPTRTPQTEKAAKGQKKNNAGGYSFAIGDLERAKRFLILGSEGNFYTSGEKLSKENAKTIIKLAKGSDESSRALVDLIVEISTEGRAPKANPALFALAIASSFGSVEAKQYALSRLNEVARIGTHLFLFIGYALQFRVFGGSLKKAVARWYTSKTPDQAAFQVVKYQSREGFSHRDVLKLSHPSRGPKPVKDENGKFVPVEGSPEENAFNALVRWTLRGEKEDAKAAPRIISGFLAAHAAGADVPALIREYGLSWEMVPTQALNEKATWEALLERNLPLGALIRQLPKLTQVGLLAPLSDTLATVTSRLTNQDELVKARIHPLQVLVALKTYNSGHSLRGSASWTPVPSVVDALDSAFYLAFKAVVPANKKTMIGLDISGSMSFGDIAGMPITPREASAALALVTMATEPQTHVVGFSHSLIDINISPKMRLDAVVRKVSGLPFGGTDASLPVEKALREKIMVDTFLIITDNDTWSGSRHTHQSLAEYRKKVNPNAKMIVLATTASRFSIADPKDDLSLDIAGFDSATPGLVADFSRGL